jgi:hypothetical protein
MYPPYQSSDFLRLSAESLVETRESIGMHVMATRGAAAAGSSCSSTRYCDIAVSCLVSRLK